ncbi:MAG: transcriptional regulator [Myxococcaceae bacterium]|nr:MAG: transcriptional regulator [Myxococcaceae bacterium]
MAAWKRSISESRVRDALKALPSVEVVDLTREIDLATVSIPLTKAYRVDGVHTYIDIVNADQLLDSDKTESERSHRRLLRYLHIFQRVLHTAVLSVTDVYRVDAQNHRTHLITYKPYDDEAKRVAVAITVADSLRKLVALADDLHEELADARVRVGIESGVALAVRNGTRGDRELLFLGNPANHAAKLLGGTSDGIYLGAVARAALGKEFETKTPSSVVLTADQISKCVTKSGLTLDLDKMLKQWRDEVKENPISDFVFTRPTPPLSDLDVDALSPGASRRIEAAAIMADVDGFTKFVADRAGTDKAGSAVRALHVIRKELRDLLQDFGGKKVRYIGDCLQGVLAEGAATTDRVKTVSEALWCVAAMRDAFDIIHAEMPDTKPLGLGIGLETGPVSITRLGVKGSRSRCIVGQARVGGLLARGGEARPRGPGPPPGERGRGVEVAHSMEDPAARTSRRCRADRGGDRVVGRPDALEGHVLPAA